jgi:hypothetical protein
VHSLRVSGQRAPEHGSLLDSGRGSLFAGDVIEIMKERSPTCSREPAKAIGWPSGFDIVSRNTSTCPGEADSRRSPRVVAPGLSAFGSMTAFSKCATFRAPMRSTIVNGRK